MSVSNNRFIKAQATLEAGLTATSFPSKAAQKEVLEAIGMLYEQCRDQARDEFMNADRDLLGPEGYGQLNDAYWAVPYDVHNVREKHALGLGSAFSRAMELAAMREKIKAVPVVKAPSRAQTEADRISRYMAANPALAQLLAEQRIQIGQEAEVDAREYAARLKVNAAGRSLEQMKAEAEADVVATLSPLTDSINRRALSVAIQKARAQVSATYGAMFAGNEAFTERLIAKFAAQWVEGAQADFDQFVAKLSQLVGEGVASATINGKNVWSNSVMTVTYTDGSVRKWHTQRIVNSRYGKGYNQWPTREVK